MVSKMARDLSFVSPLTFIQENGCPLKFFMKPCSMRNKLTRIIEKAGGTLTSELTNSGEIIRLTDPENPVEGFVSSEFVFDSVKKKVIQDINKYRIKSKKTNQIEKIVNGRDNEDNSKTVNPYHKRRVKVMRYEELSDPKDAPHTPRKMRKKKRMKYTSQDNVAILKYLEKEDGSKLRGNVIWKEMARKKVTNHSWQSMRKHYIDILQESDDPQEGQTSQIETYSAGKRTSTTRTPKSPGKSSDFASSGIDDIVDSDSDVEINLLTPHGRKENKEQSRPARGQHKASTSNDNAHDQTAGEIMTTDNEPSNRLAVKRRRDEGVEAKKDQQNGVGRPITGRQHKTSNSNDDTDDQRVVTRKQDVKSHVRSEVKAMNKKEENKEEVQERESDDESSPDTFDVYSQQVARQVTPVFPRKDRDQRNSIPSPKGKAGIPNKEPHLYPDIRVTITNQQDEVEWESDSDEFDQRLLSLAEKASFGRSCQESQNHKKGSEDETSAKDTQEDDEDEFIFRPINRRKRTERNKKQGISSAKRTCTDNEEKRTLRVTRGKSSTEKSSVDMACENSVTPPSSYESPSKSSPRRRKREKTPDTCSRSLFGDDADKDNSTPRSAKGINRKDAAAARTPDDDEMWLYVEKMAENFKKLERSPCTQGMSRSQLLHALYVSNGALEDTESYIKTGKLTNGGRPWSKEENDAIMGNEREIVNAIIKKRGQSSVWERKAFLRGCK